MASKSRHTALAAAVVTAGVAGAVIGVRALLSTPRPGAALIKRVFERNAETVRMAMLPHVPEGVSAVLDRPYGPAGAANTLDVYFPTAVSGTDARLPTVFWIHGGAWISGDKREIAPYLQILAAEGFTVVGINYPLSPDAPYPAALHDAAAALRYLTTHAARLHIDTDRIVIAGDSAGAQLGAQLSALITSPPYAGALGVAAPLDSVQLRGVVLCCGLFDLPSMVGGHGLLGWGFTQALWAYRGLPPAPDDPVLAEMSAARHVTSAFPPAFITGGNADPLTATQSRVLASRLTELDVPVETVFFAEDWVPALGHEYQFALDTEDGRATLAAIVGFLRERTGR